MLRDAEPRPRAAGPAAAEDIDLRLGLIGDNIAQSKAPLLHETAGHLAGLAVRYDRLVPREQGLDFGALFARCAAEGYRGLNITYPYKEQAARRVAIDDPLVRAMGAVNTVTFEPPICEVRDARGFNTDYSGFIAAYRQVLGARRAGRVWMIGAGGVGKAVAFGLLTLGLEALSIVDLDDAKAADLAARLAAAAPGLPVTLAKRVEALEGPADGIVNCTPVGMIGYDGTPLPRAAMRGAAWAFDAIYTPLATQFLQDAAAEGLTVIGGYELFFHQGVDAWQIFSGRPVEAAQLRRLLTEAGAGPEG
jgi:shikimate dehydrogenase